MTLVVYRLDDDIETCDVVAREADALEDNVANRFSLDRVVEADKPEFNPVEEVAASSMDEDKLPPDDCVRDMLDWSLEGSEGEGREAILVESKEPSGEELIDVERSNLGTSCAEVVWVGPGRVEVNVCVVSPKLIDVKLLWKPSDDWVLVLLETAEEGLSRMVRVILPDVSVLAAELTELRASVVVAI